MSLENLHVDDSRWTVLSKIKGKAEAKIRTERYPRYANTNFGSPLRDVEVELQGICPECMTTYN